MEDKDFEDNDLMSEDEEEKGDINVNEIREQINNKLNSISNENRITKVHPQIFFYYNSFNVILGKQGTGKTTFIMKEMIKLSKIESKYNRIVYITEGDGSDLTFLALKNMIKIPVYVLNFEDATNILTQYFDSNTTDNHIIIILEDGSFLFEKKNEKWGQWICKLRHLKATIFLNIHIWRGLNSMFKTQLSTVIVFKGYSKEIIQRVVSQTASDCVYQTILYLYLGMEKNHVLKIDNILGKINLIQI